MKRRMNGMPLDVISTTGEWHYRHSVQDSKMICGDRTDEKFAALVYGMSRQPLTYTELFFLEGWVRLCPLGTSATIWPTSILPAPDDGWWWVWSNRWNEWQGNPKYSEKSCLDATLSSTNPTWPDLGSNLDRRGGNPVTNCLTYVTANQAPRLRMRGTIPLFFSCVFFSWCLLINLVQMLLCLFYR
jgi:hypothetical protein